MSAKKTVWVCDKCNKSLCKVGAKRVKEQMLDHRKVCHPDAGFSMKNPAKQV
jgi:hypothetical protein